MLIWRNLEPRLLARVLLAATRQYRARIGEADKAEAAGESGKQAATEPVPRLRIVRDTLR